MGRVFLTGGTGFVGSALVAALRERGDEVVVLTRDAAGVKDRMGADVEVVEGDPTLAGDWQRGLIGCSAVVNLAGQSLGGQKWTAHYKQLIHDSRVEATRYLVEGIAALPADRRPRVLVSASGTEYYPFDVDLGAAGALWDEDDEVDERAPSGDTFLGRVCRNWEAEAREAETSGLRVVLMRSGIVLGEDGPLDRMTTPFKLFAGGRLGNGRQWMCWIHLADAVRGYLFAIDQEAVTGPVNLTSPNPVRNRDFAKALGRAMHRPAWLPVPGFAIKAVVGEFAEYILHGRRAVPKALGEAGFEFEYPQLDDALAAIF